jgi:hypothetical protein
MINRYRPHILVLPEDDANSQIINGFLLEADESRIQVLPEAGGWAAVIDRFCHNEVPAMGRYPDRYMILVLDFDNDADRLTKVRSKIPADLADRVFVLGVFSELEDLKRKRGQAFESIGSDLARDCRGGNGIWLDELLAHNSAELERIDRADLHQILFA